MKASDLSFGALVIGTALVSTLSACGGDTKSSDSKRGTSTSSDAGVTCHDKVGLTGTSTITLPEPGAPDSGLRSAVVHVPPSYDPTKATMLVLNFHGLFEPNTLQEQATHMDATADERGFIVAYPQGLAVGVGVSWNAGTCCGNSTDDVGFVRDLVTLLESDYCIDPKRVFTTGLSNGAMLSYRLACEASDIFAAVAPVAGAVVIDPCTPERPVPILAFHGTADNIVPFNGGTDGIYHVLTFPPVSYSIDLWRYLDACPGAQAPDATSMNAMPGDSTPDGGATPALFEGSTQVYDKGDAQCHAWTDCKQGSEVELCAIVNGGHAWPGSDTSLGPTTMDIDATTAIIDFFEKHPMP